MTRHKFSGWLKNLKKAWETRNPKKALELCAENLLWYETPFGKPLQTRNEVLKEWKSILNQKDISVFYEVLNVYKNVGIAHWTASFRRLPSREKVLLDGIFKVTLNQKGECTEFRQWYNSKK